jgi:hypothetical protein
MEDNKKSNKYSKPLLMIHGDIKKITKGEISSLDPDTDSFNLSGT